MTDHLQDTFDWPELPPPEPELQAYPDEAGEGPLELPDPRAARGRGRRRGRSGNTSAGAPADGGTIDPADEAEEAAWFATVAATSGADGPARQPGLSSRPSDPA